ncbi:MAG: hypothetical protein LBL39_03390 [Planctomycetaceae bacterium]|nr:hypothetical protein [Planctomycetaceae bacterium]
MKRLFKGEAYRLTGYGISLHVTQRTNSRLIMNLLRRLFYFFGIFSIDMKALTGK